MKGYRIEGHAIVSADDRIADERGFTPPALRNEADWARFQMALDAAAVTVLGRRGHHTHKNPKHRNRLVLSSSVRGVERREDAWWWNPAHVSLADALRQAAPDGGLVAVPGGQRVFDFFLLAGFDAFHLARMASVRLPHGVALFSAVEHGASAEASLAARGLAPGATETLDLGSSLTLTVWRRSADLTAAGTPVTVAAMGRAANPREIFTKIPFFAEVLEAEELDMLVSHARFVDFPKGATPIEEDGPGHAMYVIASGEAVVTVRGEAEPVARLGPGNIVGEMSLLTGARRSATITAATPLEMIEISKQALAHVLRYSPELVDRFADLLDRRQRELDKLAGGSAWGMLRLGKAEMAQTIRSFFGKTI